MCEWQLLILQNKFMKKNRDLDIGSWPDVVRKMYLTMKICVCLLLLGLSTVSARTYSQVRLSLEAKDKTLPEIFQEITRQSGYEFMYSSNELRHVNKVSVSAENRDLSEILAECLKNTGLGYLSQAGFSSGSGKTRIDRRGQRQGWNPSAGSVRINQGNDLGCLYGR